MTIFLSLYFRIPSFDPSRKKAIGSLLQANDAMLSKMPNLITDIRGNGGGSDFSFSNIIPYLKTNPISTVGIEYLSTSMNKKEWMKKSYDTLQKHLGEFVYLNEPVNENEAENAVTKMHTPNRWVL